MRKPKQKLIYNPIYPDRPTNQLHTRILRVLEDEILAMCNEIIEEIKKIDLREKIDSLESEVSLNLDEKLYSELLSLRNQLKGG